jgi:dTMP kinase
VNQGKFIIIEGLDGAGKTTQIKLLEKYLTGLGRRVYVTAEPTSSPTGKILREALAGKVRKTPCEMAALFVLDRIGHNTDQTLGINKMLADGYDVICDRYYYSSLAYQGTETDFDWVKAMNIGCPEIRRPDLCVFLDLDPEKCIGRIAAGRTSTEIYEKREKLEKFRGTYMLVFGMLKDNVAVVDASGSIEVTAENVILAVRGILPLNI